MTVDDDDDSLFDTLSFSFNHPKGAQLDDYCKELNNIIRTFYITLLLAPSVPGAINVCVVINTSAKQTRTPSRLLLNGLLNALLYEGL